MAYTIITFPLTALMFLSHYPEGQGRWRIFRHYLFWIGLFAIGIFLLIRGNIIYKYGWGIWWSALFDCLMFPFIRLHYKRPLLTLIISVPMTIFWVCILIYQFLYQLKRENNLIRCTGVMLVLKSHIMD
jgi:hypothetical protein